VRNGIGTGEGCTRLPSNKIKPTCAQNTAATE
jgi:hypothetical protein